MVSKIGTAKTNTGISKANKTLVTFPHCPVIDKVAKVKPKKRLPESPIKILAG